MTTKPYGKVFVPNSGKDGADILIVGEAPGYDEETERLPFVGRSGDLLWNCLGNYNLNRNQIKVMNLCHYRPEQNKFTTILQTKELTDGIAEIALYINQFKPKVIIALGKFPLFYLTGKNSITNYRGSILPCTFNRSVKVIPTYHPAYILRVPNHYPSFDSDIGRAIEDSKSDLFSYTERQYLYGLSPMELEGVIQEFERAPILSVDIESIKASTRLLCVGFGMSATRALCITPTSMQNESAIRRLLLCAAKKVFHNGGAFDVPMLRENGYEVKNFYWDTMIAQRIQWPELPSSLAYLTSLYTREPYYKSEGRANIPGEEDTDSGDSDTKEWSDKFDREKLSIYNCKDCCVTFEIFEQQEKEVNADRFHKATMDFELSMLPIAADISRQGLHIDTNRRNKIEQSLFLEWLQGQQRLNTIAKEKLNVGSPAQVKKFLYKKLELPERKNFKNGKSSITADDDALVSLIGFCQDKVDSLVTEDGKKVWIEKQEALKLIREIRGKRKLLSSYVLVKISKDGRVRSTFNVMGTETGRWSASKYLGNVGLNAQTFPRSQVDLVEGDFPINQVMIDSIMEVEDEDE